MDELNHRALRAMRGGLEMSTYTYEKALQGLLYNKPDRLILSYRARVAILESQLKQMIANRQTIHRERLRILEAGLRALNPQAILKRGYSITRTVPQKKIVTDATGLTEGQALEIQLSKGRIGVTVNRKAIEDL
jgi:exodeoxyribonuclease VII large subunit